MKLRDPKEVAMDMGPTTEEECVEIILRDRAEVIAAAKEAVLKIPSLVDAPGFIDIVGVLAALDALLKEKPE